ncbi:MAG: ABC transporter family substrate-binding protein, partial [Rhodococcus sp. (in: high G+C Gram-positive bacteria)]
MSRAGVVLVAALLVSTACTADPPPPIQSTETATTAAAAPPAATGNPVVVAIDDVRTGFNPHLLADLSPANTAVSTLVLPSPFRPVGGENGTQWVPDESLIVSADVTSQAPFTITYRLRNESQWSDGAPIAAEDFLYLWQEMTDAPGVVDPAGYDAITDVQSSDGGKTVTVVMASPYPAWRELFENLLPSHLLKDSPGGFERGLRDNVSVSGGRFRIDTIDRGRDEILLVRNDRFWGEPATPDQILLRRGGNDAQLADSMRSGDAQIAEVRGGLATVAQLGAIPNIRTDTRFRPRSLELTLNGRVPELGDVDVRRG